MIVAHHYVVNSGLSNVGAPLLTDYSSGNSIYLSLYGAWGKTGINCFLMITGYFMCKSRITFRKFLKLLLQIYFYKLLLFPIFLAIGYETITFQRIVKLMMPFWGFSTGFVSCFIVFWLTIPFLTILVQNMSQRQHQLLLLLSLGVYTILGSIPTFTITFNYITWFSIIFFIASYIRLYSHPIFEKKRLWGWLTLLFVVLAAGSVLGMRMLFGERVGIGYNFVHDSNKIFPVLIAVSSFLWFKNLKMGYNKTINAFGAGTFGVLLIHANSDAMRKWLWNDLIDCVGKYTMPTMNLILYSIGCVLAIFITCNLIDQLRIATFEKWTFRWYDNKVAPKLDAVVGNS